MYKPCSSARGDCVVNADLRSTATEDREFSQSTSRTSNSSQPLLDNSKNKCNKVDPMENFPHGLPHPCGCWVWVDWSTLLGVDDGSVPDAVDLMVDA